MEKKLQEHEPRVIAVAAAHDAHTLEALFDAEKMYKLGYILVGCRQGILDECKALGKSLDESCIIDAPTDEEAARLAVDLIRTGRAHVLMKGKLQTATLLKAVLNKETGIKRGAMSHVAVVESAAYHKLLMVTDGGMMTHPDYRQKLQIAANAVSFARSIGIDKPKIAALAAVETVSDKMPETADAQKLQQACESGEAPELLGCILEGPLSIDLAISRESAKIKGVTSQVSGDADILLAPDICTGNVMTKSLVYLGGAKMAGCVMGASAPIVLVSRGASAEEKRLSIMICLAAGTPPTTNNPN